MGMHPSQLQSCQSCNWVKDELGVDTSQIQMQTIPGGVWPRLRKSPDPVTAGLDSLVLVKSLVLGKGFTATDPAGPDSTMRGREVIQPKPIGYPESMLSGKRPVLSGQGSEADGPAHCLPRKGDEVLLLIKGLVCPKFAEHKLCLSQKAPRTRCHDDGPLSAPELHSSQD